MTYKELFDLLGWDNEVCECGECDSAILCKDCKNHGRNCICIVTEDILKKYIEDLVRDRDKFK